MGRSNENMHAKRKRVVLELLKGKEMATRLRTLLQNPVEDNGSFSADDLALKVLRSFTVTLSVLSSCAESNGSTQIAGVDGGDGSACSGGEGKKKTGVKERRGCYKRRRSCDSWTTVSPVVEDGYAWRKYGQKAIFNAQYPRCYFRCTHKYQGCKATKQVQRIKGDPILYQTTYFNHHTCPHKPIGPGPLLILDSDPVEPNILCFQTNNQSKQDDHVNVKKEEDTQSSEGNIDDSDAKSSVDPWEEIIGSGESLGYRPIWNEGSSSGFYSSGSTSLHGLDMEVNQFDDIDNFPFDEIMY